LAQKNLLVGYDIKNNIISFRPTDCTKYWVGVHIVYLVNW
jgi:hypothetical protein